MKNFMVWEHGKHKAIQKSIKHIEAFPNATEILSDIKTTGQYRGTFITIEEYKAPKQRGRWE